MSLFFLPSTSTPYIEEDLEKATIENDEYRKIAYTDENVQLVLMSIPPGGEIEVETHPLSSQFVRIEQGRAEVKLGQVGVNFRYQKDMNANAAIIIPANTRHYFSNPSESEHLKLYTLYSPPVHSTVSIGSRRSARASDPSLIAAREKASAKAVEYARSVKRRDRAFDFAKVKRNGPIHFF